MATKRGLGIRILKMLNPKLTQDAKVSIQEISIAVGTARDSIVTNKLLRQYYNGDAIVYGAYIKEYGYDSPISVSYNTQKNLYYVEMPAFPLNLPNGTGIREVGIVGCEGENTFIPLNPQSRGLYKNLYGSHSQLPRVGYWFEGYNMNFSKDLSENNNIYMKMIPASEYLSDRDEFYISPDDEADIMRSVLENYLPISQIPEDLRNNNISQ